MANCRKSGAPGVLSIYQNVACREKIYSTKCIHTSLDSTSTNLQSYPRKKLLKKQSENQLIALPLNAWLQRIFAHARHSGFP